MIRSRAPVRISFAGGGTDLPEIAKEIGGCVTSVAISKYVYGSLEERSDDIISIKLVSPEGEDKLELNAGESITYDRHLDLIKAVIEEFSVDRGFNIILETDVPSHSGLGASSAAFAAVIGLFNHFYNRGISKKEIAELAFKLETKKLKNRVGKQDQYASVFGGINFIEFGRDMSVRLNPLNIDKDTINELEKNLLLFYITERRKTAGETIVNQTDAFSKGRDDVIEGFKKTKELGIEAKKALESNDLSLFGNVLSRVWEYKKLFGGVSNQFIEDVYQTAVRNGAYGGKITGAGGGGCGFWFCRDGKTEGVKRALEEMGAKNIGFRFDFDGLKILDNRVVFLDRDGVLNEDIDLLRRKEDIQLIDGSIDAVKMFNDLGFRVIVITNQPQVAKGRCTEEEVKAINEEIRKRFAVNNAVIDAFYYCPHHPESGFSGERAEYKIDCSCRKPNTGMLEQAKRDFDLDLNSCYVIGDRTVDVKTGVNAGCKTILLKTGHAGRDGKYNAKPDYTCDDLQDAANMIKTMENVKQMKCVILAGGRGERLRPLTDTKPKPMLLIDGKPILEHQIELLKSYGIRDVVICGYYLFDEIRNYFGDGKQFGVNIEYYEDEMLGTGGAIKNAEAAITNTFLVLYGDEMIDMDLAGLVAFHKKNNAGITMVLHETDHPQDSDLVSINGENRVLELHKKPNKIIVSKLSKSSVYVIEPSVLRNMPDGRFDLDRDFINKYIERNGVYGYVTDEFIKDIGTLERLEMVDEKLKQERISKLKEKANSIRKHIIMMTAGAGSGHPGGSLSCADIMAVLFFDRMRYKSDDPDWEYRDRFVLSKGHAAPALYAALAEAGYFSTSELKSLRKVDSMLQGHPSIITPGVEICSGSLGQGLSVANGMALAGKIDKKDYNVYVLIGDGESQEGQIWEAAMTAAHYKLDNLIAIIDRNGLQIDGKTEDIMSLEPLAEKWRAFGWDVTEIDGHNLEELANAINKKSKKPRMIIANTIKGKGVSFMEHVVDFHGAAPTAEEAETALKELGE